VPLNCYGENSATFLIFKALSDTPQGIRRLLLSLRAAGIGNLIDENLVPDEEPVVWLFPNFGKRHGFGEPDALILLGDHSFWFEVETRVNLGIGRGDARQSLIQLARFHLLHKALMMGSQVRVVGTPHMAIMGRTVSDSGRIKIGILRSSGHPVLQHHANRLRDSKAHFVLMSILQASGNGSLDFSEDLGLLATEVFAPVQWSLRSGREESSNDENWPNLPGGEPIWYTYWRRNAFRRCFPAGPDPLHVGGWRIRAV
jgi:hypothetical protein